MIDLVDESDPILQQKPVPWPFGQAFPTETFETGMQKTVAWYLNNPSYIKQILDGQNHHMFDWHEG